MKTTENLNTKSSNKGLKIFAVVVVLAVLAGAYLYFQSNKDNLPPELKVEGQTTQGFLKAQYLDFLTPTAEDEKKFDTNVTAWKTAQITPTPLRFTATNKGQHYLYWDGELGTYGTFTDLVENVNPSKAKMLFGAKWDPVNRYFLTTPHNYYKKVDSKGNILTKVLDGPDFGSVEMAESEGVVFASAGTTEVYGFKDGNTFAENEYGICSETDLKVNGWHLFAAHTANLDQLFKDCYEGEILAAYEQTSVDPVSFKRIADFSKALKYSMVWVNKGDAISTWKPAEDNPTTTADHVYKLFGDKLTVEFNDKTQEVYQIKLEPSSLQLVRNTSNPDDTYIEILTETEDYVGKFEFNEVTKKFEVDLKSSLGDKYKVLLGDYSSKGLSKKTILIGALEKVEAATAKSVTVKGKDVNMVIALPKGVEAKYVREMYLTAYEVDESSAKTVFEYTENYEKEKPVTENKNVKVTYPKTNTDVIVDITGLNYEKSYTFKVVLTVADKNTSKLMLKESKALNVEATTDKTPDHTYTLKDDTLEVNFNDDTNQKYPLYKSHSTLTFKVLKLNDNNYVGVYDNDKVIGVFEFNLKTKAFEADPDPKLENNGKYTINLGDYTSVGLGKNQITVLRYDDMSAAKFLGISALGNGLNTVIEPPAGVDVKTFTDMELFIFESKKDKVDLDKDPLYYVEIDYAKKKLVAVNKKAVTASDMFSLTFPTNNVGVLASGLKFDTTYTIGAVFFAKSPDEKGLVVNHSKLVLIEGKTAVDPAIAKAAADKAAADKAAADKAAADKAAADKAAADKAAADKAAADKAAADKAAADKAAADHVYKLVDDGARLAVEFNNGNEDVFDLVKLPENLVVKPAIGEDGFSESDTYVKVLSENRYIGYFEFDRTSMEFKSTVNRDFEDKYKIKFDGQKITLIGPSTSAQYNSNTSTDSSKFKAGDEVFVKKDPLEPRWYTATIKAAKNDLYEVEITKKSLGIPMGSETMKNIKLEHINSTTPVTALEIGQQVISKKKASNLFTTTTVGWFEAEITEVYKIDGEDRVYVKFRDGSDNKGQKGVFGNTTGNYVLTKDDLYELDQ